MSLPETDLVLERVVSVPAAFLWRAWTEPELIKPWFCPKPWYVSDCATELKPGGRFMTVMNGPNGEEFRGEGCFVELAPPQRLVWTSVLQGGFRPNAMAPGNPAFTCVLSFTEQADGTLYKAHVMHCDAANAKAHADMGFHQGWGAALDQLVALYQAQQATTGTPS